MTQTIAQQIKWDFEANGRLVIDDKNGNRIYFELADGFWVKRKYDSNGKEIYFEISTGYWSKYEYDSQSNQIYFENSEGKIINNRSKPSENKVIEIDDVKYKLTKK